MASSPKPSLAGSSSTSTKRKPQRGPQKRTFHFFIKIVDAAGQPIPGAQMQVARIISDARKVIEFMDTPDYGNLGLTRVKHEVTSNPRGGEDETTSVG